MPNPNQIESHVAIPQQAAHSETVQQPPQAVDPNALTADPDKVFSRQHADGTVHQGSADVARQECPAFKGKTVEEVLGAMTMAEMGKQMRAAKEAQSAPPKPADVKKAPDPAKSNTPSKPAAEVVPVETRQAAIRPIAEARLPVQTQEVKQTVTIPISAAHQEVFQRIVRLEELMETPASAVHAVEAVVKKAAVETAEQPVTSPPERVSEPVRVVHDQAPEQPIIRQSESAVAIDEPAETLELAAMPEHVPLADEAAPLESAAASFIPIEGAVDQLSPAAYEGAVLDEPEASSIAFGEATQLEAETAAPVESEPSADLAAAEAFEAADKTPAVIVAEFMVQALPAEAANVYERIQELAPEAAVEVAAKVDSIVVVSDRLHELVVQGNTDGEEGQQIVAYLKREYEMLLRSVDIEPTEELINDFIAYVFSQNYQMKDDAESYVVLGQDDGMREKKLFDEQSVFAKAQQAAAVLGKRLGSRLGKLAVTYDAH